MELKISAFYYLHEQGKRANNEDFVYPKTLKPNERIFVVCDGVGGATKGEVASELASHAFYRFFKDFFNKNPDFRVDESLFLEAFDAVQANFDEYIEDHPNARGMATTAVLAVLSGDQIGVLHCGDSRFYHLSAGKIQWQTDDHTVVNELLKHGVITPEEAQGSSQHKLSRAIMGNAVKKTKPAIQFLTPQDGDYGLLCTDGIYNSLSHSELEAIFAMPSDADKTARIHAICQAKAQDNYSMILFRVEKKDKSATPKPPDESATFLEQHPVYQKVKSFTQKLLNNHEGHLYW